MRQRSAIQNWVEYIAVRAVFGSLAMLPRALALKLANVYVRSFAAVARRWNAAARRNLALTGYPWSYVDGTYLSLARMLVTIAHFPSRNKQNIGEWIRYDGFEHFEEGLRKGKGVLFATAHLGNWELSAFAHALMAAPMHIVVRPLDNPLIDAFIESRRTGSGNRVYGKREFARGILKALSANEAVGILVDQNVAAAEGVFVDFFGRKACVSPAFAKIAAKTGATVIPGFAVWNEAEKRYVLKFYPPVTISGDATEDTQRVQAAVEKAIREYPEQWLWIHRRWKTRPEGEAPIY